MSWNIYLVTFVAAIVCISGKKEKFQNQEYKDEKMHVVYQMKDGRMNGSYTSYYPNGIIKAQGFLENGFHKGIWIVQDSLGKMVVKREYSGPFNFKSVLPKVPGDPTIELFDKPYYSPKRNKDGFFDLFYLEENSIVAAKRIWRSVPRDNNSVLFDQNLLYEAIQRAIHDSLIRVYDPITDEFRIVLESVPMVNGNDVVSFLVKEDWVFDNKRNLAENRMIGICPQVLDPLTGKTKNLYWIYFPELREQISKIKIEWKGRERDVKTLDDLFFLRCFYSQIVKESNVYDRSIADYKLPEDMKREMERIELSLIELEHSMWCSQTSLQ